MLNLLCDVSCGTCWSAGSEHDYCIFLHCNSKPQISLVKVNGGKRRILILIQFQNKIRAGT